MPNNVKVPVVASNTRVSQSHVPNNSPSPTSYLSKLPDAMIQNLYRNTRQPQKKKVTDVEELIFAKLREIDKQYYAEEGAKIVKTSRYAFHDGELSSPSSSLLDRNDHDITSAKSRQRPSLISSRSGSATQRNGQKSKPSSTIMHDPSKQASLKLSKATPPRRDSYSFADAYAAGKTGSKSKSKSKSKPADTQVKLAQLLGKNYARPKASISAEEVTSYLTSRAGMSRRELSRCMAEYSEQKWKDAFTSSLKNIEALVACPASTIPTSLGKIGSFSAAFGDSEPCSAVNVNANTEADANSVLGRTVFQLSDFRELVSSSGLSKTLPFQSRAGDVFDNPAEKIRLMSGRNTSGPMEEEKRRLENKKRILLQALKRTESYSEKETIMAQLQGLLG